MEDQSVLAAVLLPLTLTLIMAGLGLSLTVDDFKRIFRSPRGVLIGLANLLLISPLIGFGVAELFGLEAALAVGLVLLAASPGGTTANLLTHLARGDTALSVSMTALSSLAAIVTVPAFLALAVAHFDASVADDVSMGGVVARVFLITVVPLSIGMVIRARRERWAIAQQERVKRIGLAALVLVAVAITIQEFETVRDHFGELALAALTFNLLAMGISFTVARAARLSGPQATAVAMELGVHNTTLAITTGALVAEVLSVPAAIYSGLMYVTAGLFARLMFKRNAATEDPAAAAAAQPA
jgi:BASS family bile acid:Na+ symporter